MPFAVSTTTDSIPLLEVDTLSAWRGDKRLFADVSFTLHPGEVLHIRGPNGSGKTTLLRILCGLRFADEGSLRWCGEALPQAAFALRNALAFIGHTDGVKLELTALKNAEVIAALRGGETLASPADALAAG